MLCGEREREKERRERERGDMQFLRDAARDGATRLTERIKASVVGGEAEGGLSAVSALSAEKKEITRARATSGGTAGRDEAEATRREREEKLQELEEEYMEEVRYEIRMEHTHTHTHTHTHSLTHSLSLTYIHTYTRADMRRKNQRSAHMYIHEAHVIVSVEFSCLR